MISPRTADEARMPPAIARTCGITSSADMTPTNTMVVVTTRRTVRYFVATSGASSRRPSALSTSFASTSVATTTIAAVSRRCQLCMCGVLFGIESLASCEPFFQPVPERNLVLAESPAEEDLLTFAERGEVDEAGIEVLDDCASLVDRVHAAGDLDPLRPVGFLELAELARVDAAAVAGDPLRAFLSLGLKALLLAPVRHELLDERANLCELLVGFPGREAAWHPTPMIRASWSPVNESSSDPGRGRCPRGGHRPARRSRSSSGRGSRSGSPRCSRYSRSSRCGTRRRAVGTTRR